MIHVVRFTFLTTILLLSQACLFAQSSWLKTYGGSLDDYGKCIRVLGDGGVIIAGVSNSSNYDMRGIHKGANDVVVIRMDMNGEVLWKTVIGGSGDEDVTILSADTSSGQILVGGTRSSRDGDFADVSKDTTDPRNRGDVFVAILDSVGNMVRLNVYGGSGTESLYAPYEAQDGGIVALLKSTSVDGHFDSLNTAGSTVTYSVRVTVDGTLRLGQCIDTALTVLTGLSRRPGIQCVTASSTGELVVAGWAGYWRRDGREDADAYIACFDSSGMAKWVRIIGGSSFYDDISLVRTTSNGGYIVSGTTNSWNGDFDGLYKGAQDVFVMSLDHEGKSIWTKVFGGVIGDENVRDLIVSDNGDVVVTGQTYSYEGDFEGRNSYSSGSDAYVICLDSAGRTKMIDTYGGNNSDWATSLDLDKSKGNIYIAGTTTSNDGLFRRMLRGRSDMFVLRIDTNGRKILSVATDPPSSKSASVALRPNPASDITTISYMLDQPSPVRIDLFNSVGEQVSVLRNQSEEPGSHEYWITTTDLPSGIYNVRVTSAAGTSAASLVVHR